MLIAPFHKGIFIMGLNLERNLTSKIVSVKTQKRKNKSKTKRKSTACTFATSNAFLALKPLGHTENLAILHVMLKLSFVTKLGSRFLLKRILLTSLYFITSCYIGTVIQLHLKQKTYYLLHYTFYDLLRNVNAYLRRDIESSPSQIFRQGCAVLA